MPVEAVARPLHHPIFADLTDETAFGDTPPSLGRSSEQHPRALFADPYLEDADVGDFEVANGLCYVNIILNHFSLTYFFFGEDFLLKMHLVVSMRLHQHRSPRTPSKRFHQHSSGMVSMTFHQHRSHRRQNQKFL